MNPITMPVNSHGLLYCITGLRPLIFGLLDGWLVASLKLPGEEESIIQYMMIYYTYNHHFESFRAFRLVPMRSNQAIAENKFCALL